MSYLSITISKIYIYININLLQLHIHFFIKLNYIISILSYLILFYFNFLLELLLYMKYYGNNNILAYNSNNELM